jgi:cytochrome c-type biogenesis protein CcmH/NrfG
VREAVRDGRRLLLRQRFDEAEDVYRAALEVRPGNPALLLGMSKAALAQGDLDRALGYARKAVQRAPSHASYHLALGDVLRALGKTAEADAAYDRATKLSPKPVDRVTKILPPNPF